MKSRIAVWAFLTMVFILLISIHLAFHFEGFLGMEILSLVYLIIALFVLSDMHKDAK